MGKADFLAAVSMSIRNASANRRNTGVFFTYRGMPVSVTEGINAIGAKKVFILLGLNDLGSRRWEDVKHNYDTLIKAIQRDCPDAEIVIQGVFPVPVAFCRNRAIRIDHWNAFNQELRGVCEENGVELYDFGAMFMDKNGYMKNVYASGEFHLSEKGNQVWLRALRIYAAHKLEPEAALLLDEPVFTPQPTKDPTPAPTESPTPEPVETLTPMPESQETPAA